jgi:hypothetical protein
VFSLVLVRIDGPGGKRHPESHLVPAHWASAREPGCDHPGLIDDGYWQGAPVGGMGAGTFSRSYRGDFSIAGCMGHPIFCSRYRTLHLSSDSQTASRLLEMTKERPVTSFRLVLLDETGWFVAEHLVSCLEKAQVHQPSNNSKNPTFNRRNPPFLRI